MKLTARDKKAWALGFQSAHRLLAARVADAFQLRKAMLDFITSGERSPIEAPDEWPEEKPGKGSRG